MEVIEAYKIKDGQIFEDHKKAVLYCEELDGLLKTVPDMGYRMLLNIMKAIQEKPEQLALLAAWSREYNDVKNA